MDVGVHMDTKDMTVPIKGMSYYGINPRESVVSAQQEGPGSDPRSQAVLQCGVCTFSPW